MNKNRFTGVAVAALLTLPAFNNAFGGQDYPEPFGEFKWSDNWKTVAEKACALGNVTGINCSDIEGSYKAVVMENMRQRSADKRFQSIGEYKIVRPVTPWYEIVVNNLQIGGIPYKLVLKGGSIPECSAEMILNNRTDEMLVVGDPSAEEYMKRATAKCESYRKPGLPTKEDLLAGRMASSGGTSDGTARRTSPSSGGSNPYKEQCLERVRMKYERKYGGSASTYYGYPIFDSFVLRVAESGISPEELKGVEKVFRGKYGNNPLFVDATLITPWNEVGMRNLFVRKSADISDKDFYEQGPENAAAIDLNLKHGRITYYPPETARQRCSRSAVADLKNNSRNTSGMRDSSSSL